MSELLNTHFYDGKLLTTRRPPSYDSISNEEKKYRLESFCHLVHPYLSPQANMFLDLLLRDIGTVHNYCTANQMRAEDVLLSISEYFQTKSAREIQDLCLPLSDQLSEISLGPCPAGRVTRLYQVWFLMV